MDVPLLTPLQEDGFSCVPRCVKMLLDYISKKPDIHIPLLNLDELLKILDTKEDGTIPGNVRNLNNYKGFKRTEPSVEFEYYPRYHEFKEIIAEIREERPVIVYIEESDTVHSFEHAIVITGVDENNYLVYYNDPIYGKKEGNQSAFMSKWDKEDRTMIKVKIGQRKQKFIEEYPTVGGQKDEDQ